MAHRDAVIHGDGVELLGDTTRFTDRGCNQVTHVFEVNVPRDELRIGVGNRDNRFTKVLRLHTRRTPEGTGSGHVAAVGGCA